MNKPRLLSLEDAQTALWRVTPASHPNENSLAQQMYYHGKCDALRVAMQMIEGEIDVTWKSAKKEKPRVEQSVLGIVPHFFYLTIFYEDGTIKYENSEIEWIDDNGQEYIPEGWYMKVPVIDGEDWEYDVIKISEPSMWMELVLPSKIGSINE